MMIRLLVVDDHSMVRCALCRLLDSEPDMQVVAQSGSGREAVHLCRELEPSVVVVDYTLPDLDGLETTRRIVALGSRVLMLTMYANEEYAIRVIRAGGSGFVVKVASTNELMVAIRRVAQDGVYVSSAIVQQMVEREGQCNERPDAVLTDRERQVLIHLARGAACREVSRLLCLSPSSIETYRRRILDKLALRSNSDLTRFAIRRRLLEVG